MPAIYYAATLLCTRFAFIYIIRYFYGIGVGPVPVDYFQCHVAGEAVLQQSFLLILTIHLQLGIICVSSELAEEINPS